MEDLGISYPTIVKKSQLEECTLVDPNVETSDGGGMGPAIGPSRMAADNAPAAKMIKLLKFDFVVQFCWQPKTPAERRKAKEAAAEKAKKGGTGRPIQVNHAACETARPPPRSRHGQTQDIPRHRQEAPVLDLLRRDVVDFAGLLVVGVRRSWQSSSTRGRRQIEGELSTRPFRTVSQPGRASTQSKVDPTRIRTAAHWAN